MVQKNAATRAGSSTLPTAPTVFHQDAISPFFFFLFFLFYSPSSSSFSASLAALVPFLTGLEMNNGH